MGFASANEYLMNVATQEKQFHEVPLKKFSPQVRLAKPAGDITYIKLAINFLYFNFSVKDVKKEASDLFDGQTCRFTIFINTHVVGF